MMYLNWSRISTMLVEFDQGREIAWTGLSCDFRNLGWFRWDVGSQKKTREAELELKLEIYQSQLTKTQNLILLLGFGLLSPTRAHFRSTRYWLLCHLGLCYFGFWNQTIKKSMPVQVNVSSIVPKADSVPNQTCASPTLLSLSLPEHKERQPQYIYQ